MVDLVKVRELINQWKANELRAIMAIRALVVPIRDARERQDKVAHRALKMRQRKLQLELMEARRQIKAWRGERARYYTRNPPGT